MINIKLNGEQKVSISKIREAGQIGHDLSPDNPPVIESVGGGGKWAEVKNEFRDNLSHWAEAGKASKTIVCLKPHRFGAVNRPEDAVWLADQIKSPWLKLAYDYSHFIHRDIDFEGSLKTMIPHTRFIHVKDTIIKDGKPRFVIPGESGQIDYAKLVSLSAKLDYRGDINTEISGQVWGQKGYDPIATAIASYKNLATAF
jgi:inosose dehydratase